MPRKFTVESWLFSLYLGVAPVYWLPGVSPAVVGLLKATLVGAGVGMLFSRMATTGLVLLPRGLMGPVGFVTLILLSLPGLVQAREPFVAIKFVVDIGFCVIFLWCFYNLARQGGGMIRMIFVQSLTSITLFAATTVVSFLTGLPDWHVPAEMDPSASFTDAGFGSGRTGWSNSLALYLPGTLFLLTAKTSQKFVRPRVFLILMVGIILVSQIASGGRTGMLVSLFTIVAFMFVSLVRRMVGVFVAVGVLGVVTLVPLEFWITHLRLDRFSSVESFLPNLNTFSANRIKTYIMAVELIREQPLRGYGMGQILMVTDLGEVLEIHNLWLKWATESGIFLPLFFLAMVCSVLCKSWQFLVLRTPKSTNDRIVVFTLALIVLAGIAVSLAEPRTPIGTFHNTAVWWAAIGILLGTYSRRKAIDARYASPW